MRNGKGRNRAMCIIMLSMEEEEPEGRTCGKHNFVVHEPSVRIMVLSSEMAKRIRL